MKIVFTNPSMQCGGSERVISKLANYWVQEGHEVTIVTTDREEPSYFDLNQNVKRIGILKGSSSSKLLSIPRKFFSIIKLRKVIRQEKPDMVLAFQEKTAIYTLISLAGVELFKVVAIRNHPEFKRLGMLMSFLRRRLYKNADVIVSQTSGISSWVETDLNLESNVIPNPVDDESADNDLYSEQTIYACGRLVPQKGCHHLINIFNELLKDFPEWKLTFLGDGIEKKSLSQRVKDIGIENKVNFMGRVKNPKDHYSLGGIFAFTSEYEGYPNALCEAMASGMAVVSFDCPSGPSDLIKDGINGFIVKAGDKESMQNRLKQLMNYKDLRLQFGTEAEKIKEELAIETIAAKWIALKDGK